MARAKIVTDSEDRFWRLSIKCPAGHEHCIPVTWTPAGMARAPDCGKHPWGFNGDLERPTLTPSILMKRGHYCNADGKPGNCACDFQQRFPDEAPWRWPCMLCHSFVKDGRIEFLPDCTHPLAGKTVDLPEVE